MRGASDLAVRMEGVNKWYGSFHALKDIELSVNRGERIVICGPSGSGKSTLIRWINQLETIQKGRIVVDGHDLTAGGKNVDIVRQETGMVFQQFNLFPHMTVLENCTLAPMKVRGISKAEAEKTARRFLERVRIPSPERRLKAYPHEMTGGMRQRAMIALALACRPKLLLADEPTTALDATVQIQILLLLRELQREFNMAAVFVTHDIGVAVEVADKLAVMYAGEFVETGSVRDLIRDARHPYTRGLLAANLHGVSKGERLEAIPGAPPALDTAPVACSFAPRCRQATGACRSAPPPSVQVGPARMARCILQAPAAAA